MNTATIPVTVSDEAAADEGRTATGWQRREAEWRGDPVPFFEAQFQLASDLARDLIE